MCGQRHRTRIIWDADTVQWGETVVGKALDDRVPLAVTGELLRRVPPACLAWDLTLVCTVQEEIGTIGALTRSLETCAGANGIPIQHAILGFFGSDSRALMQADIPSAMIVFPARYTFSPFEMGDLRDIGRNVQWLAAFCINQT